MAAKLTVSFEVTVSDVEPDGSECFVCGDSCYLTQANVLVKIGQSESVLWSLCCACQELLDEVRLNDA